MNFLFGALLLIILLFPGVMFRVAYLSVPFSSKSFKSSFLEELLFSLVPAFIIQIIGYLITESTLGNVDENGLFLMLINNEQTVGHALGLKSIGLFALYMVSTTAIAYWLGTLLRILSKRYGWHLRFPFLRLYNEWQLYFEGITLDKPDIPGSSDDIQEVWIDVVVENKNDGYIYSGLLDGYIVDKDDKLDRVYLSFVRRRKLSDDRVEATSAPLPDDLDTVEYSTEGAVAEDSDHSITHDLDKRYYLMPGDYFMIPGAAIKNINIIYYSAEGEEDVPSPEE